MICFIFLNCLFWGKPVYSCGSQTSVTCSPSLKEGSGVVSTELCYPCHSCPRMAHTHGACRFCRLLFIPPASQAWTCQLVILIFFPFPVPRIICLQNQLVVHAFSFFPVQNRLRAKGFLALHYYALVPTTFTGALTMIINFIDTKTHFSWKCP